MIEKSERERNRVESCLVLLTFVPSAGRLCSDLSKGVVAHAGAMPQG